MQVRNSDFADIYEQTETSYIRLAEPEPDWEARKQQEAKQDDRLSISTAVKWLRERAVPKIAPKPAAKEYSDKQVYKEAKKVLFNTLSGAGTFIQMLRYVVNNKDYAQPFDKAICDVFADEFNEEDAKVLDEFAQFVLRKTNWLHLTRIIQQHFGNQPVYISWNWENYKPIGFRYFSASNTELHYGVDITIKFQNEIVKMCDTHFMKHNNIKTWELNGARYLK